MKLLIVHLSALVLFAFTSGCATAPPTHSVPTVAAISQAHETSFDIVYDLGGHGEHRLAGSSPAAGAPHVATFFEREVVDEAFINADRYAHYLEKIVHFTEKPLRIPAQKVDCRAPYWITLKIDGKTYTSKGCREGDGGEFAKLVREGEFLLYSKK